MSSRDDFETLTAESQRTDRELADRTRQIIEGQIQRTARIAEYGHYAAQVLVAAHARPTKGVVQIIRHKILGPTKSSPLCDAWDLGHGLTFDGDGHAPNQYRGYVLETNGDVRPYTREEDATFLDLDRKLSPYELLVDQLLPPLRADQNTRFEANWDVERALADLVARHLPGHQTQ